MAVQVYVRRDVWALGTAHGTWESVTLAYANAVAEMQRRSPTDPTSWTYQAAIHGTYAAPPSGAPWNQCQHASWFFLPWHRMYIYWFERIVRSIVLTQGGPRDWALPYWNYSKGFPDTMLPPAFRQTNLPNGSPNPLYVQARNPNPAPGINGGAQIPARAASHSYAFGLIPFTGDQTHGFGGKASIAMQFDHGTGAIENQPHNVVHDLVGGPSSGPCRGGLMSDPQCAALDPVFWLHHANIDRLWARWIDQGQGRANPTVKAWYSQDFPFYDETGSRVTMRVSQVLDTATQLGYIYDDQPPAVARRMVASTMAPAPEREPEMIAASRGGVELCDRPVSVDIPLEAPAKTAIRTLLVSVSPRHLYLNVEGIDVEENPGIVYEIFLNLPEGAVTGTSDDAHFVGHVTFFTAKHAPDKGRGPEGGLKHTFDVTGLVRDLEAQGLWNEDRVKVTFAPLGLLPPPGVAAQPQVPAPRVAGRPPRISRVSIFRA